MRTSSGVSSFEKAVLLAASVGYDCEVLGAEGASIVAAIVLVEACCLAWSAIVKSTCCDPQDATQVCTLCSSILQVVVKEACLPVPQFEKSCGKGEGAAAMPVYYAVGSSLR